MLTFLIYLLRLDVNKNFSLESSVVPKRSWPMAAYVPIFPLQSPIVHWNLGYLQRNRAQYIKIWQSKNKFSKKFHLWTKTSITRSNLKILTISFAWSPSYTSTYVRTCKFVLYSLKNLPVQRGPLLNTGSQVLEGLNHDF